MKNLIQLVGREDPIEFYSTKYYRYLGYFVGATWELNSLTKIYGNKIKYPLKELTKITLGITA